MLWTIHKVFSCVLYCWSAHELYMMHVHRYYLQKPYRHRFCQKEFSITFHGHDDLYYTKNNACELIIINSTNTVFIQVAFRAWGNLLIYYHQKFDKYTSAFILLLQYFTIHSINYTHTLSSTTSLSLFIEVLTYTGSCHQYTNIKTRPAYFVKPLTTRHKDVHSFGFMVQRQ